jgi:hypothetical protein
MTGAPMLKVTGLWERTSAAGNRYMSGRLAGVKVLILENRDRTAEDEPTHHLFFVDGTPRQESSTPDRAAARRPAPARRWVSSLKPSRVARGSGEPLPDDPVADLYR